MFLTASWFFCLFLARRPWHPSTLRVASVTHVILDPDAHLCNELSRSLRLTGTTRPSSRKATVPVCMRCGLSESIAQGGRSLRSPLEEREFCGRRKPEGPFLPTVTEEKGRPTAQVAPSPPPGLAQERRFPLQGLLRVPLCGPQVLSVRTEQSGEAVGLIHDRRGRRSSPP